MRDDFNGIDDALPLPEATSAERETDRGTVEVLDAGSADELADRSLADRYRQALAEAPPSGPAGFALLRRRRTVFEETGEEANTRASRKTDRTSEPTDRFLAPTPIPPRPDSNRSCPSDREWTFGQAIGLVVGMVGFALLIANGVGILP